jgi:hypothetical protein
MVSGLRDETGTERRATEGGDERVKGNAKEEEEKEIPTESLLTGN